MFQCLCLVVLSVLVIVQRISTPHLWILSIAQFQTGKHEPAMKEEMEKDIIALMSEEVSLQQAVANETLQRADAALTGTRRVSSLFQKEAEKCNMGVATCEEARERAEAELAEELRLSDVWERRAPELGWNEKRANS